LLYFVVGAAESAVVAGAGAAALVVGRGVVDVALPDGLSAGGEPAGDVAAVM
jgi:hypothetical protein